LKYEQLNITTPLTLCIST